jgi:sugar phosphate isomerase/epimerase
VERSLNLLETKEQQPMKLGFSLSPNLLLDRPESSAEQRFAKYFGNSKSVLKQLKENGINSIEIRYLPMTVPDPDHARVCHVIWEAGLQLTVHGELDQLFQGKHFVELYPSIQKIAARYADYQDEFLIIVHAFSSKSKNGPLHGTERELAERSVELLRSWIDKVSDDGLKLRFALELDHEYPGVVQPGRTPEGILRMLDQIGGSGAGITWDMGHYYSNLMLHANLEQPPLAYLEPLPPESFLDKVIHTHIHGMGIKGAHYPMNRPESLPLERYVQALAAAGYTGVYNLELTLSRLSESGMADELFGTIERLRNAVSAACIVNGGST